ncbi:hypothetical protein [Arsukibacterium sp.]|uniref:hypothetical protein n=1 Tax=Arsukibacterium sp. TaxID=1977258 RepID=UPI002FDB5E2E
MRSTITETVTAVHHWNDTLFSIKATRSPSFTFENGQFVMIGIEVEGRPDLYQQQCLVKCPLLLVQIRSL